MSAPPTGSEMDGMARCEKCKQLIIDKNYKTGPAGEMYCYNCFNQYVIGRGST